MAGQKGSILICATDQEYEEVSVRAITISQVQNLVAYLLLRI